ncbi:MAG: class I SAM-dependent methyltransferase [Acidimicrobiales bacterium]
MIKGFRGLSRFQRSCREAFIFGLKSWSTAKMRDANPRFDEVWSAASSVPGWFYEANAVAIFQVLTALRPRRVVEIGSYMGKSTVFFARSLETLGDDGRVTAIDPHSGDRQQRESFGMSEIPTFDMFRTHLRLAGVEQLVDPVTTSSSEAAKGWTEPFQFLFVDGWHSYDAVLADGRDWVPNLDPNGVVVFDDALHYGDVRRAIAELDREGTIHLWGHYWGQAYAGRIPTPPPSVRSVLAAGRIEHFARRLERALPGTVG